MEAALDQPLTPLGSLTKRRAKTADFLVRVYYPKKIENLFKAKRDGNHLENVRSSCILLGEDAGHYCEASVKTSTDNVNAALEEYKH